MLESIGNTISAALSNLPFVSRSGGLTELVDVQNGEMWQGFGVTDIRVISPGIAEVTIGGKNAVRFPVSFCTWYALPVFAVLNVDKLGQAARTADKW